MDATLQIGGAPFILLLAKPFVQVRTNIRFKGGRSSVILRTYFYVRAANTKIILSLTWGLKTIFFEPAVQRGPTDPKNLRGNEFDIRSFFHGSQYRPFLDFL